ncbi:MAG: hypothetical protein L0Y64_19440, partial [Myxococcaceae bacterium]|nr:hypothetical protein [Myxococcaceae bacterium]
MAQTRPKSGAPSNPEAAAEAVLRNPGRTTAHELVHLIHEVNPSGRELSPAAETRRYALKSRLQSLLIRRFRGELEVERVVGQDDVVGLRHRPTARDACHAAIDALDDEARAWVRLLLDLRASGAGESDVAAVPTAPSRSARRAANPGSRKSDPDSLLAL